MSKKNVKPAEVKNDEVKTESTPKVDNSAATKEEVKDPVEDSAPKGDEAVQDSAAPQEEVGKSADEVNQLAAAPAPNLTAPPPPSPEPETNNTNSVTAPPTAPAPEVKVDTTPAVSSVQELEDPVLHGLGIEKAKDILAEVPPSHYAVFGLLNRYANDMHATGRVDEKAQATNQVGLYRVIQNLINREEQYFRPMFQVLLLWFEKHADGCLHPNLAHRAQHLMAVNAEELAAFNSLLDFLRLLGPTKGRQEAMKQISFKKALQYGLTDAGRQRVEAYFYD